MSGATPPPRLVLPVGVRDHAQGPEDAPVTLVEYGDYQCPYCGEAFPIVRQIQKRLGPKLRFVFRNFPIGTSHPNAPLAAEAAEAAGAQGRFWEMHDMLYEHQSELEEPYLLSYAQELKVELGQFRSDLERHSYRARVQEDFMSGVRSGVNGTPTFYINGVRHDDSYELKVLLRALESQMGASAGAAGRPARRRSS